MGNVVAGRPLAEANSWADEVALTLVGAAKQRLANVAAARAQHAEHAQTLHLALAGAQGESEAAQAKHAALVARHETAQRSPPPAVPMPSGGQKYGGFAIIGAGLLAMAVHIALSLILWLVGIAVVWSHKKATEKATAENERSEFAHRAECGGLEAQVREARDFAEKAYAAYAAQHAALTALAAPIDDFSLPVKGLVRVLCPVTVADVAGYTVVVSPMAAAGDMVIPSAKLDGLGAAGERLGAVLDLVAKAGALLSARNGEANQLNSLIGEETDLKNAMLVWLQALRDVPVTSHRMPIVSPNSPVLPALRLARITDDTQGIVLNPGGDLAGPGRQLAVLAKAAEAGRAEAASGPSPLRLAYDRLHATMQGFAERRTDAKAILQSNFMTACARAELLAVHRYCPRCNRIPGYFFQKLGCGFEEAHLQDTNELLARACLDPDIAGRLRGSIDLRRRLSDSHEHVRFMLAKSDEAALALQLASPIDRERGEQMMGSHVETALQSFRGALREVLTGSPLEHVELARSARLHLNPANGHWTCAACETTWSDPEITRLGEVDRVKGDLLVPLWNTLWTEKDDFRKSEVFRTNEELTTYTEKEGEKLLMVHESYKADLRGVRERLVSAAAEAEHAEDKLEATLDGLQSLELMSTTRANEILARLRATATVSAKAAKREAERNETVLGAMPRQQQATRPAAADPVNFFFSPRELFGAVATQVDRFEVPQELAQGFADRSEVPLLPQARPEAFMPAARPSVAPRYEPTQSTASYVSVAPPPPRPPAPPPRPPPPPPPPGRTPVGPPPAIDPDKGFTPED